MHLESKKFLNSQVYRFTLLKFISSLNLKVIYGCSVIDEVVSSFNLTAFSLAFLSLKTSILKIKVREDECVYGRTLNWTHPQVSKTLQFSKFNECLLCSAEQISQRSGENQRYYSIEFHHCAPTGITEKKKTKNPKNPQVQKFVTDAVVLCCVKKSESNY